MLEWLKESAHRSETCTSGTASAPYSPGSAPRNELIVLMANMMEANDYGIQPEN